MSNDSQEPQWLGLQNKRLTRSEMGWTESAAYWLLAKKSASCDLVWAFSRAINGGLSAGVVAGATKAFQDVRALIQPVRHHGWRIAMPGLLGAGWPLPNGPTMCICSIERL